jgi:GST-like protein
MIDVYSWTTGNARKIYIMLEETGLPYRIHPVNISKGDQFKPEFLAISPNNKIPAIVERDGPGGSPYSLFETGAILMYLAHKTGRFLPEDPAARSETIQWLMFQMGEQGPQFGQAGHFVGRRDRPGMAAGLARFVEEADRIMRVLDRRFAESEFAAGPEYTIADMALYPWCQQLDKRGLDLTDYGHCKRWFDRVAARPAAQKADEIAAGLRRVAAAAQ